MNRPSFQFYPQDWGDDPALQMCSLEARGLWIEMMRLMHKGQPYGYLQLNGAGPVDIPRLARYVRADEATVTSALQELETQHVFSKTGGGIIFSRRMVRDEEQRQLTRKRVKKHRVTKKKRNAPVTREKRRSSSSSSSSSNHPTDDSTKSSAGGGAAAWKATAITWDDYRAGVSWDDDHQEVKLSDDARKGLWEHLERVAEEEGLRMLSKPQLQEAWGRLSTHLIAETRKRGPKTLPGLVRGWFTSDMRKYGRGPPSRASTAEPRGFQAIREVFGGGKADGN